nr:unnamed protein product [Callosobruchus analis]
MPMFKLSYKHHQPAGISNECHSIQRVSENCGVPFTTLKRHHNKTKTYVSFKNQRPNYSVNQIFSSEQEKSLREYFISCTSLFYDGTRIFNLDETSTTGVHKPQKVIALKGKNGVAKVTSAERGTLVPTCCHGDVTKSARSYNVELDDINSNFCPKTSISGTPPEVSHEVGCTKKIKEVQDTIADVELILGLIKGKEESSQPGAREPQIKSYANTVAAKAGVSHERPRKQSEEPRKQ